VRALSRLVTVAAAVVGLAACAASRAPRPTAAAPKFHMRLYYFVLLKRGPQWTPEKTPETRRIFEGHMANIRAMGRAGKLLIAGPFEDEPNDKDAPAGIFIFDVPSADEVRRLLANDPAITSGRLTAELLQWYGPAGLTFDGRAEAMAADAPAPP
jgi:uncharacterized protein YciI